MLMRITAGLVGQPEKEGRGRAEAFLGWVKNGGVTGSRIVVSA